MKEIKVRITLTEGMLGTAPADKEIYSTYIGSAAPDAKSLTEEIEAVGVDAVEEKGMTVFPRDENGQPMIWDYQIKGFFKDACGVMRGVKGTESEKLKSYKKKIDGLIFVYPRKIHIDAAGPITICQRPLRAQTMQGERVALSSSEEVPAGSTVEFSVECMDDSHEKAVIEWLDYGKRRGLGQWRNSGKGRFTWELIE